MTEIIHTVEAIRARSRNARANSDRVALVPTMGGLHEGHLSLVRKAREIADVVIVSIFVNPTQFNNPEDFENYPSDANEDLSALKDTGTDFVFMPSKHEMYPAGFSTRVDVDASNNILCDAHRPGHFSGVATVVSKLFTQTEPDYACFGEKDFQQLFIIRRLVSDLNFPIEIVPVKTVREPDGLALSSRNARLSKAERQEAPALHQHMQIAADAIINGANPINACEDAKKALDETTNLTVEYFECRSGETLELIDAYEPNARLFAAAWLGKVRLIDNIPVNKDE